jgi:hypothetical protein
LDEVKVEAPPPIYGAERKPLRREARVLSSYSDIFELNLDLERPEDVVVGDIVRTGPNDFPRYEVIAIRGDRAWVRNGLSGDDHIVSLLRCRRVPANRE